jgi:DNA-binding transcriptional LysR family regulator
MQNRRTQTSPLARRLRWDDARILLALLQTRSLLAAGKALGLNASTVSRRLDALERTLGGRLFDRSPEGALPTALAEEMAPHAEMMERAAVALAMTAEGREVVPEGEVRITAPPGYAEYLLAPAMPRLLARYPALRVTLDASARVADLTRREADLAVRSERPTTGDLVATKLGSIHAAFLTSPRYAASLAPLRRLSDARWITWGPDFAHVAPARFIAANIPEASIALRTSHLGTQVAAAEAGVGVLFADRNLLRVRRLAEVPLAEELRAMLPASTGELWLVGHRALRDVPRIAATWDFLLEEAKRRDEQARPARGKGRGQTTRRKRMVMP